MSRRKQAKPRAFKYEEVISNHNGQSVIMHNVEETEAAFSGDSGQSDTEMDFDEDAPLLLHLNEPSMEEQLGEDSSCDSFSSDIYSSHTSLSFSPSLSEGAVTPNSLIHHDGVIENNNLLNGNNAMMVEQTGLRHPTRLESRNSSGVNERQGHIISPSTDSQPQKGSAKNKLTSQINANGEGSYKCQFCKKVFPRLGYLKKHEQSHAEHMPFRCDYCARLFKHKRSRDRHIKLHTGDRRYRCPHCETAFSRSDHLKIHMKTHDNQKPFQCTVCNRGYSTAAALTSHMQNHKKQAALLGAQGINYSPRSSGSGSSVNSLKRKFSPLVNQQNANPSDFLPSKESLIGASSVQLTCEFCTIKFSNIPAMIQHIRTTHIDRLNSSNAYINHLNMISANYSAIANFRGDDLYKRKADDLFPINLQKILIKSDKGSPDSIRSHPVSCDAKSHATTDYTRDIDEIHIKHEIQESPTDLSNKRASSRNENEEIERAGSPEINRTNSAGALMMNHNQSQIESQLNKPDAYVCSHCNAAFPTFETFRIHLNNHLKQGELSMDNLFTCQMCGLSMPNQSDYDQHIITHFQSTSSEFACVANCNKCYTKSEDMQKHLFDVHTQNIWKCMICAQLFDSKVSIQVHLTVAHTNEMKVIRCQACMEAFKSEKDFRHHVKTRHSVVLSRAGNMQCTFCHTVCANDLEMQLHLVAHSRQFRCPACPEVFHVEFLLDRHMQTNHCGLTKEITTPSHYKTPNNNILNYHYAMAPGGKYPFPSSNKLINPLQIDVLKSTNPLYGFYDSLTSGYNEVAKKHLIGLYNVEIAPKYYISTSDPNSLASSDTPTHHSAYNSSDRDQSTADNSRNDLYMAHTTSNKGYNHNSRDNSIPSSDIAKPAVTQKEAGLVCGICERNDFMTDVEVHNHRKLVHNIKTGVSLRCAYCNDNFRSRNELENHMKISHNTNGKHKCLICDEIFASPAVLAEHKLTHSKVGPSGKCSHCSTLLNDVIAFKAHMSEHGNIDTPTQCICCRQTLSSEYEIGLHAKFHTKSTDSNEPTCALCLITLPINTEAKICEKCYRKHNFNQKYSTYAISGGTTATALPPNDHNNPTNSNPNIEFNCNICHKILPNAVKLEEHLIEHSFQGCDDRGFTCYICSSVFTSATGINQHMSKHGSNSKPYDCNLCPSKFFFRAELENHLIEHESGRMCTVAPIVSPKEQQIKQRDDSRTNEEMNIDDININASIIKCETEEPIGDDDDDEYIEIEKLVEYPNKSVTSKNDRNCKGEDSKSDTSENEFTANIDIDKD